MSQLLERIPATIPVSVTVEVADAGARVDLPRSTGAAGHQSAGSSCPRVRRPGKRSSRLFVPPSSRPARASGPRVRPRQCSGSGGHLFDDPRHFRALCTVRGYWKHGRAGDSD